MTKINNISVGNAGEYFVAAELERHGFSVAVPMSNTELFDVLAFRRDNKNQYAIQVKSNHSTKKEWVLSSKHEEKQYVGENIVYIFVCMNGLEMPEYHIVPSTIVAEKIKNAHSAWLDTPGRKGVKHKDNPIRKFKDYDNKYLNKWEILK